MKSSLLFLLLTFILDSCGFRNNRKIKSNTELYYPHTRINAIADYTHYLDYIPYRLEGVNGFEDFRTAPYPPSQLLNRKMFSNVKLTVETVLADPTWPNSWYAIKYSSITIFLVRMLNFH